MRCYSCLNVFRDAVFFDYQAQLCNKVVALLNSNACLLILLFEVVAIILAGVKCCCS
jgi:hypothetical protein